MRKHIESIPTKTLAALSEYHWPGNVRELENIIERALIVSRGPELEVALPELKPQSVADPAAETASESIRLQDAEREHILKSLRYANRVIGGARGAAKLGLNRSTLQSKMKKLGIVRPT